MGQMSPALMAVIVVVIGLVLAPLAIRGGIAVLKFGFWLSIILSAVVVFIAVFLVGFGQGIVRLVRRPRPVPMSPMEARQFIITSDSKKVIDFFRKNLR